MKTTLKKLKQDKGVGGVEFLLAVVVMLFTIGFIIMIFALMGGELSDKISESSTFNGTAVSVINSSVVEISGVTDWYGIIIVITAMVVLISLTIVIIAVIRGSGMLEGGA